MDISVQALLLQMAVLIFSVILHEVSHGLVAQYYGDDTALYSGRLTLNPLPHLDPVGSVVFPALCVYMHMPVFGWAKPVPVNPNKFRNYRSGVIGVSLAGPLSNFLISFVSVLLLALVASQEFLSGNLPFLPKILLWTVRLNLILAVFNLFPIPPLDGSKVVSALLPFRFASRYDAIEPYGFFIIMGLMAFGILGQVLSPIVGFLDYILLKVVGF